MAYRKLGNYVEVEPGIDLYVEEVGSGTPLIFIPGWTFTTELFDHQIAHFADRYRVITYDPRSHGRSTVTLEGNNFTTHGTDLIRLMKALDVQDAVLVGWSFGALIAWEVVRQMGTEGLKGVVTIDLSPKTLSVHDGDWVEGPMDEIAGAYNSFLGSPQGHRDFVTYYATEVMVQRDLAPEELAWIVDQSLRTPTPIAALNFASGMFSNYLEEAKLVDQKLPALTIIAEHWAETAVPFMNKHCPATKTAVLGGHMMFWEHPAQFNELLDNYLSAL
ncbi:MAG: hypothetical protein OHK0046_25870 [Anaerolineae bacterium]